MKVTVNGKVKNLKEKATLKDAVAGEHCVKGAAIAIVLSTSKVTSATNDFALMTPEGEMILHLDNGADAERFRQMVDRIEGVTTRWITRNIAAFGSFPSDIQADQTPRNWRRYDCFFSLGGNDNQTTYVMIARNQHQRAYGAGAGRIGRITVGRHLLSILKEGDHISNIRPVVSETDKENAVVTTDLTYPLQDGYQVSTNVKVKLEAADPLAAEQILIVNARGYIDVADDTGTFLGCRDDMDTDLVSEPPAVRDVGAVMVRNEGVGKGHIMLYRQRRQMTPNLSYAGHVTSGMVLAARAHAGDRVSLITDPPRALAVGMTQKDGENFLARFGIKQKRTGDTADAAVIVDQNPEQTMNALKAGEVETLGVPKDKVFRIKLSDKDEKSLHYFKKVTGLSHKPIGQLRVQFSYPGMAMITFYGDDARSQDLYPQDPFRRCRKGDIGMTNQSRPHHGLIGIRLVDSKQYGPTGEEGYGTNLVGRFEDDLSKLDGLEDEQFIYITEEKL
ncbi:MAG: methanogenesis marker 3 protein [Candidatus Methanomethylophilus sp.]|nr:methanogenesis marker 3 protein [Methanomethylophilus sp.]MDD3233204.1 methanogenesis marker 3 protein [Methanomethylophilus sp.]MDD4668805.1 methanogenesis marker 3 protein [Methanomethylophilus sp.]